MVQKCFVEEYIKDDEVVKVVWKIFDVVLLILESLGKVKNLWLNVDVYFGVLLVYYGLKEYSFYIVLFGVLCVLGVLFVLCWFCVLGFLLEWLKFVIIEWVKSMFVKMEQEV